MGGNKMGREYHVSQKNGHDWQDGSAEKPFVTISKAAKIAMPGDTITVHEGVYREWKNSQKNIGKKQNKN